MIKRLLGWLLYSTYYNPHLHTYTFSTCVLTLSVSYWFVCHEQVAHPSIRSQLLGYIYNGFLVPVVAPALHKVCTRECVCWFVFFFAFFAFSLVLLFPDWSTHLSVCRDWFSSPWRKWWRRRRTWSSSCAASLTPPSSTPSSHSFWCIAMTMCTSWIHWSAASTHPSRHVCVLLCHFGVCVSVCFLFMVQCVVEVEVHMCT